MRTRNTGKPLVKRAASSSDHPHQVWARTLLLAMDSAKGGGIDIAPLCEGLPFDENSMRKILRVDWDDYCTCLERIEEAAGGPEGVRALTRAHYYERVTEIQALAGRFIPPKIVLRFIIEVLDPIVFPTCDFTYEDTGSISARVGFFIRPGLRGCKALFRGTHGALEALPMALGLPPGKVEADFDDRQAVYDIEYAKPKNRQVGPVFPTRAIARLVHALVLGHKPDGTPLAATLAEEAGPAIESRLDLATHTWNLTPRQSEILRILVRGKSNKEIAADLDCAESTIETHVTQILSRVPAPSRTVLIARFWSEF